MKYLVAAFCLISSQAAADLNSLVSDRIIPGFSGFEKATSALKEQVQTSCFGDDTKAAFHTAFDAWMNVDHYRVGPSTTRVHEVIFWPDSRGFTPKTLRTLISDQDQIVTSDYSEVSIAARGLMALEYLLYDDEFEALRQNEYSCDLIQAIASDLHLTASDLVSEWTNYATSLKTAADGNEVFRDQKEAEVLLYTQLISGLEFDKDTRISQPLGTFDKSRPKRAEAWRSGRSLRNILLGAKAIVADADALYGGDIQTTEAALEAINGAAERISAPNFSDITEPQNWLYLSILQDRFGSLHDAVANDVGVGMGLSAGFNSSDGD